MLLFKHGCRVGVECKRAAAATLRPSLKLVASDTPTA